MGRKGVHPPLNRIQILRDYFQECEPDGVNPYGFYKYCQERAASLWDEANKALERIKTARTRLERASARWDWARASREAKAWEGTTYINICKIFSALKKVGMVELLRTEPPQYGGGKDKRFYIIAPNKKGWFGEDPRNYLYPTRQWGGSRYKAAKKFGKEPPEVRWPPES